MDYTVLLYHTPRKNSKVFMQKVVERNAPARPFGGGKPARPSGGGKPAQKQKRQTYVCLFYFGGVVPSKSEPNSAVISSIVAVFEPSL